MEQCMKCLAFIPTEERHVLHAGRKTLADINRYLILFKGKDRTADIQTFSRDGRYIRLKFFNDSTVYTCGPDKAAVFADPEELPPDEYVFLSRGYRYADPARVQEFSEHWRIFRKNGNVICLKRSDTEVVHSCLGDPENRTLFEYFKDLAFHDSLKIDGGASFLGKQFAKLGFVPDNTILAACLSGVTPAGDAQPVSPLYYPFGFNASQKKGVERALSGGLSIIEGPPGTGKTQTILNILANIVMRGQKAAVVSSNNSATRNVEEKLEKYGIDFICAFLGNQENRKKFLENQKVLPDMTGWTLDAKSKRALENELSALHSALNEKLEKQNQLAELSAEYAAFHTEQAHFLDCFSRDADTLAARPGLRKFDSGKLLRLLAFCETKLEKTASFSFWNRVLLFLHFSLWDSELFKCSPVSITALLQKHFYERRLAEIKIRIDALEAELRGWSFKDKMDDYAAKSMTLFKHVLSEKYAKTPRRTYERLWAESGDFTEDYPVVLSTTHSLRSSLSGDVLYDYVIVDESSQVSLCSGMLALSCARRAVIVGDLKQLPNVVDGPARRITDALFRQYGVPEEFRISDHSLLRFVSKRFPDAPRTLLREHYRCHPSIIGFCNEKFYNGELIVLTKGKEEDKPLKVYRTVPGNHAHDRLNQREIDVIAHEVFPENGLKDISDQVGIVTPYRAQADALHKDAALSGVAADTVDKFQGQERSTIILSTVDNDISDFADDDHRLNVAVSRAVNRLIVVTSGNKPTRRTSIGDLVSYIGYHSMEVTDSKVCSVFDLLYRQYADARRQALARLKRVSQMDSENLMFGLIEEVLKEERREGYGVHVHVPLRMLLRDTSLLTTERERQYALNRLTHVDFLIFEKMGRNIVAALEVDGWTFHRPDSAQAERDSIKESICKRYGIPLFRFSTTGSGEKERLRAILREV